MAKIRLKRGTRAQIEAAAVNLALDEAEPYLVTDEGRVGIGTSSGAWVALARQDEVGGSGPYDSGWRDVTALMPPDIEGGLFLVRRIGSVVHIGGGDTYGGGISSPLHGDSTYWEPPVGWRPSVTQALARAGQWGGTGSYAVTAKAESDLDPPPPYDDWDTDGWPPGIDLNDRSTWPPDWIGHWWVIMADSTQAAWVPGGSYITDDPEPDAQDLPGVPWTPP